MFFTNEVEDSLMTISHMAHISHMELKHFHLRKNVFKCKIAREIYVLGLMEYLHKTRWKCGLLASQAGQGIIQPVGISN